MNWLLGYDARVTATLQLSELTAVSPIDGRYAAQLSALRPICSEYGLLRYRVQVELRWMIHLAEEGVLPELVALDSGLQSRLRRIADGFDLDAASRIKQIETTTNHDVKAVEYYLREELARQKVPASISEYVHFACTSEDINNLAYALMLSEARAAVVLPGLQSIITALADMAHRYAAVPMLSRTHGQPATPTTLGKELATVAARLKTQRSDLEQVSVLGKFNGAVGNYNAHYAAAPEIDWPGVTDRFIVALGLQANTYTTQIEPHDWISAYSHALMRCNSILLDFARDIWGYVSLGYFKQNAAESETGSSTMPHKVNPIDFENAEGNIGIAQALLAHFAEKLPVSRWQRDLSDSTVLRNVGVALAHSTVAHVAISRGLAKLAADEEAMHADLSERWELLAEPIQTVMRRHGLSGGYEELKTLTRGKAVDRNMIHRFIDGLALPDDAKKRLLALEPANYLGNAVEAAKDITDD
ncbi:MAG: adenylosuccinate lyase [Gammaproteobacteria bacterium]|nr:adenylosuccinate lyase [Gammaproteobacteria bacterium]